ncbi:hypothetical protein [Synechococcus sp. CS-1327]|uniref:hypothetical protein n=1 Tax=Synechococcus sp. CS-1327 TaxID=2847977 RepID=UPI00223B1741|nr:hypothetical protein [Synechococcus sp. CS-1327]MCT0213815.1 hypothetical protein [Synechococcus sp. CS-1326]MCT0233845.1 hypothetical protein [Synechococcus sp. CS-1327]
MASDPYLSRINKAPHQLGLRVAIELTPNGQRLRLRATVPPAEGPWRQRRISTRLAYPQDIEAARELPESWPNSWATI